MDLKRLDWILAKAEDADLTAWEDNFVTDIFSRRQRYGDRITISPPQEQALERIAEKVT